MAKRSTKKQKVTVKEEPKKEESCACEGAVVLATILTIIALLFGGYKLVTYLTAAEFKVGDCLVAKTNYKYYKVTRHWESLEEYELQPMKVQESQYFRDFLVEDKDKWTLERRESYVEDNFTKVPCG